LILRARRFSMIWVPNPQPMREINPDHGTPPGLGAEGSLAALP
jgi:hypothetical protein